MVVCKIRTLRHICRHDTQLYFMKSKRRLRLKDTGEQMRIILEYLKMQFLEKALPRTGNRETADHPAIQQNRENRNTLLMLSPLYRKEMLFIAAVNDKKVCMGDCISNQGFSAKEHEPFSQIVWPRGRSQSPNYTHATHFPPRPWRHTHRQCDRKTLLIRIKMSKRLLQKQILHRLMVDRDGREGPIAHSACIEFGRNSPQNKIKRRIAPQEFRIIDGQQLHEKLLILLTYVLKQYAHVIDTRSSTPLDPAQKGNRPDMQCPGQAYSLFRISNQLREQFLPSGWLLHAQS